MRYPSLIPVLPLWKKRKRKQSGTERRSRSSRLEQTLCCRDLIGAGRHVPAGVLVLSLREPRIKLGPICDRLRSTGSNPRTPRSSSASPHAPTNPLNSDANAEDWAAFCEEKAQLEAELKQRDKRILCLRQVFAGKTSEFREALSAILGVKLAFYDNGQVRVTSQYDLGAAFIFQPAPKDGSGGGARMQLVAQELLQLMRNWVEIEQSIPCFLASVTLECYDKWKREQQNGRKRD
ncbi:mitotic checkpoint protein-domain-containing protein [Lactarius deliciosus]|nr:mitotic checkpoint protein-domain-containing protein [Lactarius deliciosus]